MINKYWENYYNDYYNVNSDTEIKENSGIAPRYSIEYPKELWSEILPNLYMGGTDDLDIHNQWARPMITPKEFDTVVTLYQFANPVDWFVKEIRYGFYDVHSVGGAGFNYDELLSIVKVAHEDWKKGKKVLVRCQAGMNRSGLITALILIRDGYTAQDAINLIRIKRIHSALFNKEFVNYLLTIDVKNWRE